MEKEFVTYEQALSLKELGLREDVLAWYDTENKLLNTGSLWQLFKNDDDVVLAPLKQQVFRWFREQYNIIGIIEGGYTDGKNVFSYVIWQESDDDWTDDIYDTYEEAENACIDKLIELVKQHENA